jgi:hypothetical protein
MQYDHKAQRIRTRLCLAAFLDHTRRTRRKYLQGDFLAVIAKVSSHQPAVCHIAPSLNKSPLPVTNPRMPSIADRFLRRTFFHRFNYLIHIQLTLPY